jgi:hypothetical protein
MSGYMLGWRCCGAILPALWLCACGGGGGGANQPSPELLVTSNTISVSASTDDPAPTATIHASISNPGAAAFYFSSGTSNNGIESVTNPPSGTSGDFTVHFKGPSTLGPSTTSDTVTIKACTDSACEQPIEGSPIAVQVSYIVAIEPHIASIGPSTVVAGGQAFQLVVTGLHFDTTSEVVVNGSPRSTFFISATSLIGNFSAQDIASAGSLQITVVNNEDTGVETSSAATLTVSSNAVSPSVYEPVLSLSASSDTSLGGGPTIQQAFTVSVNGPTNATYYYVISFTGSAVSSLMGLNGTLQTGTTTPAGPTAGRITGELNGGLGGTVSGSFTGTLANISVGLQGAAQLGAGTYTDTITVTVCTDSQCAHPIGSPQTISVSYVVTGNPIPDAQLQLAVNLLILEAPTSTQNPAVATVTLSSNGLPPYGAYVFTTVLGGSAVAGTTFQSNLDGTGTLTVTSKPPASLGSGVYTGSVQVKVCFDAACSKPASQFPQVVQVTYVVDASAGVDFTQQSVPGEVADLQYSAVHDRIYATANSDTGNLTHSLVVINPSTASVEQIVSLGQVSPTQIELSDDGQFAYIVDQVTNSVVRVVLNTLTIDETVPLTLYEGELKVAPGQPNTFAVETDDANYSTLRVFDGTVQRPQTFTSGSLEIFLPLTWGADDTTIYGYDRPVSNPSMYQLSVSSTGLAVAQDSPLELQDVQINDINYVGGLIYTDGGSIYDPLSAAVRNFPLQNSNPEGSGVSAGGVTVDTSLSRAYVLTNDAPNQTSTGETIEGFNLSTLQPTWIARFPRVNSRVVRWGTNGLAFFNGDALNPAVIVLSGSVVTR